MDTTFLDIGKLCLRGVIKKKSKEKKKRKKRKSE
jgi:hypothetical protein